MLYHSHDVIALAPRSTGAVASQILCSRNGSWQQQLPWGGVRQGVAVPKANPSVLQSSLPPQAGVVALPTSYLLTASPDLLPISLTKETKVRKAGDWRLIETKYKVRQVNDSIL